LAWQPEGVIFHTGGERLIPDAGRSLEDEEMKRTHAAILLAVLAFLLIWPFIGPEYQVYLTLSVFAYSVALLGLNLLFNYTGLLSFGHALFIGLGGYTAAFLTSRFGVPYIELSLLLSVLRPLCQDLFRHAHPGVRDVVPFGLDEDILFYGRR
jgi:hypothetical protein